MVQTPDTLSPGELAAALGVSESSVKRWIDDGRIPAMRTPGGHRRVALPAALRFVRETRHAVAVPATLGLADADDVTSPLTPYAKALKTGDEAACRGLALLAFVRGEPLARICDDLLLAGFQTARDECNHPSSKCVVLHRAVAISQAVLHALRDLLPTNDGAGDPPRVLLADIGYEIDALPTDTAELLFREAGYACTQLGRDVPEVVLTGAIERERPAILWLSAAGPADERRVRSLVAQSLDMLPPIGAAPVLYGSAAGLDHADATRLTTMSELAAWLAGRVAASPAA